MEIRLLGPFELRIDGQIAPLPRRQHRALLAALALRAGGVASTDRLVEDLWGAGAPTSAVGSLQNAVSGVRKVVGRDLVATQAPGYRLAVEPDAVDALRFEQLLAGARGGRGKERAELLRTALAMWRGPALADLAFEPFAAAEIARLEELRLGALEERLAVDLELGLHAELVPELEALVAANPLREQLRGQLMLALYRCGRQAEALGVYRMTRLALADELGLSPSRELQELEQAILRQDASLSAPSANATPATSAPRLRALSSGTTVFGRTPELAELETLLARAAEGRSGSLLVRGEPGIGKSTILECAAERSGAALVLHASGFESESELVFAGLADLLRPIAPLIESLPEPQAAALSGALGLGPVSPGDPYAVAVATLSLLSAAAKDGAVVVLVDDVHWLDSPSQQALVFVAQRLEAEGVALVLALRDDPPLPFLEAARLPEIRLGRLDATQAEALLEATDASLSSTVRRELVRAAAGVPLALVELPRLLTKAERAGSEPLPSPLRVAGSIEAAFRPLVEALAENEHAALLVVAADDSGDPDVVELALRSLGLTAETLDGTEEIGARNPGGRFGFRHPLLRSLLYHGAPAEALRRAHAALADALEARGFEARSAWHRALAATGANAEVANALEGVATEARSRGGFGAAATAGEKAARLTPDRELRAARLVVAAGDGQLSGQLERSGGLLDEAEALSTDPLLLADVQGLRAQALLFSGRPMDAHALLVDAAERISELSPDKAALMLAQAVPACQVGGWISRGTKTGERAVAIAARGSEQVQLLAATALAQVLILSGDAAGATFLRERIRAHPRLDDPLLMMPLLHVEAGHLMVLGEHEAARETNDHLVAIARGAAAPGLLPFALATQAEIDLRTGRWLEATSAAAESAELAAQTGQVIHIGYALMILGRLLAARGSATASEAALDQAAALADGLGIDALRFYVPAARAFRALGLGDLEAAAAFALQVEEISRERGLREPGVVLWPPDLIEALDGLGRSAEAKRTLERFQDDAEATGRLWALATASRCRGILAADDAFEAEFENALIVHEGLGMPFERARTDLCLGERLLRAGRPAEAPAPLRRALSTFERLGARPWSERAAARLRSAGEPTTTASGAPTDLLTEHELRVALAAATGASPQEVAAQLFLSPKTVEHHWRGLYGKLGIDSDEELRDVLSAARVGEPAR